MTTINEKSSARLTVNLLDATGAPAAPTSVTYRIDCQSSGQSVRGDILLNTPGASFDILLTSTDNVIKDPTNQVESKRVTLTAVYGAGDQLVTQYDYLVNNLNFIS